MDWLRSEDLKEEKVVTTSLGLYHARRGCACSKLSGNRFAPVIAWACAQEKNQEAIGQSDTRRSHQGNGEAKSG
jgi:hypothetical protein